MPDLLPSAVRLVEELQVVLRHVLKRQENERRDQARQLHDEMGQVLAILKLHLDMLSRLTGPDGPRVQDCLVLVQRAVEQARTLALQARPSLLDDLGLIPALRWLVQSRTQETDWIASVVADPESPALSAEGATLCYRIAEDAIDNVRRHAQAKRLTIEVRESGGAVEMAIRDDGIGFSLSHRGASAGLLTMRERVRLAGGQLDIQSQPGAGTLVHVILTANLPREWGGG